MLSVEQAWLEAFTALQQKQYLVFAKKLAYFHSIMMRTQEKHTTDNIKCRWTATDSTLQLSNTTLLEHSDFIDTLDDEALLFLTSLHSTAVDMYMYCLEQSWENSADHYNDLIRSIHDFLPPQESYEATEKEGSTAPTLDPFSQAFLERCANVFLNEHRRQYAYFMESSYTLATENMLVAKQIPDIPVNDIITTMYMPLK